MGRRSISIIVKMFSSYGNQIRSDQASLARCESLCDWLPMILFEKEIVHVVMLSIRRNEIDVLFFLSGTLLYLVTMANPWMVVNWSLSGD